MRRRAAVLLTCLAWFGPARAASGEPVSGPRWPVGAPAPGLDLALPGALEVAAMDVDPRGRFVVLAWVDRLLLR